MSTVTSIQHRILSLIKQRGAATNSEIADELGMSYEAIRQKLRQLEAADFVAVRLQREAGTQAGRPTAVYRISTAGDHLFPKAYDQLAVELLDKLSEALGPDALREVLAAITDDKVRQWAPQMEGRPLPQRLEMLKDFYIDSDPHTETESKGGCLRLVEHNCPFLNVASRRPALCSVTISTLSRLLGFNVTREKRFQDGDGQCSFLVHTDQPVDPERFCFEFEEESPAARPKARRQRGKSDN